MEVLFKTHFWIIKLLGASAALAFAASAVVTHLSSAYLMDDATLAGVELNAAKPVQGEEGDAGKFDPSRKSRSGLAKMDMIDKRVVGEVILAAKLFCPTCGPAEEEVKPGDATEPEAATDAGPVPCTLPLTLVATMEAENPRYSIAVILNSETQSTGAYWADEEVQDDVTIVEVSRTRAILRNNRRLEFLDLAGQPPPVKPKTNKPNLVAPPKPARKPRKNSRAIEGAAEAISCTGDSCVIDKAFRDKLLANPSLLAKQARVIPAVRDGESRGFKFYGIRSGSLPKLLGMRNGDMVTAVNGIELKNVDQVLGLYTKLRRASHLTVTYERKNKTSTKEISFK